MSRLTVTEKNHWKERITKKLDRAIDRLWAEEAGLKSRLTEKARKLVREKYPDLPFAELEEVENRQSQLLKETESLEARKIAMSRTILQKLSRSSATYSDYHIRDSFKKLMEKMESVELQEVMETDPIGRQIKELENEKEELLDTVWLATSSAQVKQLWSRFLTVLDEKPTQMQKEAIEMEPGKDEELA